MDDYWKSRPCLVTGGAGFGGAHLCEALIQRGARVFALDLLLPRNSYLRLSGMDEHAEFIAGDICNFHLVRTVLERFQVDTVFHLAAQSIVPLSNVLPYETFEANVRGTYTLLEAVRLSQVTRRFVFASSAAYYGATTTAEPIHEDQAPQPAANVYSPSKVAADCVVRAYAQVYGLKTAACRFINSYGPGDTNFSRIVPRALQNLIQNLPYDFGDRDDGTTRLDYLHIRDMARAYLCVAEHLEAVAGEALNLGTGGTVSTQTLAALISRLYDGQDRAPAFHGAPRATPIIKQLDVSKARRLLGWEATIPLETGLRETIEWYQRLWEKL